MSDRSAHLASLLTLGTGWPGDQYVSFASSYASAQEAWDACPNGMWMAGLVGKLAARQGPGAPVQRQATLVSVACVRVCDGLLSDADAERVHPLLGQMEQWAHKNEAAAAISVTTPLLQVFLDREKAYTPRQPEFYALCAVRDAALGMPGFAADSAGKAFASKSLSSGEALAVATAARDACWGTLAARIRSQIPVCPNY